MKQTNTKKEILKKGKDGNDSKILRKLTNISDGNWCWKGNYKIKWEIAKLKEKK